MLSAKRKKIQLIIAAILFFCGAILLYISPTYKATQFNENALREIQSKWPTISILTDVEDSKFISDYFDPASNPKATRISSRSESDILKVILAELPKYPPQVLEKNLHSIAICKTLNLYGVNYGGTASKNRIYMTSAGKENNFTHDYLASVLHHEFSSVLVYNNIFPLDSWFDVSKGVFKYSFDQKSELEAVQHKSKPISNPSVFYSKGFVKQYGMTSYENDINTYAETLFTNPEKLRSLAKTYPLIKRKYDLIKNFYIGLAPKFDWSFL